MTSFRNKGRKNLIEIFSFNSPMVAISQRSIPKDQLYENKKQKKKKLHAILKNDIYKGKNSLKGTAWHEVVWCSQGVVNKVLWLSQWELVHNNLIKQKKYIQIGSSSYNLEKNWDCKTALWKLRDYGTREIRWNFARPMVFERPFVTIHLVYVMLAGI